LSAPRAASAALVCCALLAASCRLLAANARAEPSRVIAQIDAGVRGNPLGLGIVGGVYYRDVWSHDAAQDFDTSYLQLGGTAQVNPAYLQPSVHVELVPVPFLVLRAEYALQLFMGMNTGLLRFDSERAPFGADVLDERKGDEQSAVAQRAQGQLVLRAAVDRLYASIDNQLYFYAFHDPGPYLYESEFDTLLERRDFVYNGRAQVALDVSSRATLALTLLGGFYERTEPLRTDLRRQRVGGFVYFEPERGWLGFAASRVFGQAGVNLEDRNREHGVFGLVGAGVDFEL
jgi:hypothetical protein